MGNAPSHQGSGGSPPPADAPPSSLPPKDNRPPPPPPTPQTPLLMPYGGHLSPQNPHALSHPQAHDYCKEVVCELILDGQLAPFYRGLDDFEESWTEDDVRKELKEVREKDYDDDVDNSFTRRLKDERDPAIKAKWGSPEDKAERSRREAKAYLGAVECPICFLNYPPNINTSRCCDQPLCTECFVQIKRSDATVTHLESDAACCPFCVESDFGVIYERPSPVLGTTPPTVGTPLGGPGSGSAAVAAHALSTSPDQGDSGFSQALSLSSEPLTPTTSRNGTTRRKSVSSKAKEVITIDQIRPDWEAKLNAVKAAAARRAARRIVMRQVGDRLIPIGYTSSRATGTADFSMSIPQEEGRRSRRTRERERELEEMMIMEAMRLSLLDQEEHQRKSSTSEGTRDKNQPQAPPQTQTQTQTQTLALAQGQASQEQARRGSTSQHTAGISTPTSPMGATPSSSRRSSNAAGTMASWRASSNDGGSGHNGHNGHGGGRAQAAASKLLSKITVNRSRANSKSSVHFAASPTTMGGPSSSSSSGPGPSSSSSARARSASASTPSTISADHHPSPLGSASLGPASRRSLDVTATRQPATLVSDADSITEFSAGPSRPTPERSTSDLIDMGGLDAATPPDVDGDDGPSTPRLTPQAGAGTPTVSVTEPVEAEAAAAAEAGRDHLDVSPSRHSVAESFESRSSFAASYTDPVPRAARAKPLAAMADDD